MTAFRTTPHAARSHDRALSAAESGERDRGLVLSWCRAHGVAPEAAADIAQDVCVKLVAMEPEFPNRAAQVAWLRRVTSNACIDALRRVKTLPLLREPTHSFRPTISEEERRALREAISQLSEAQRLVLVAKAVEQVTFVELAADLGIAVPTVKTHYRRAVEALRDRLNTLDANKESDL